ncbi:MAG: hypothetical protein CBR30_02765 [Dictyoglomus sp. NZ13-RE01]|nr:MAG: hypothetical protein CBR30_02765 [Dictyoglomus sp. NZ13-RE01]
MFILLLSGMGLYVLFLKRIILYGMVMVYLGGTYTLAREGYIVYTITAVDYAGNSNMASGRLILDIPDLAIVNFYPIPNPFSPSLDTNATYTIETSIWDTHSNQFNIISPFPTKSNEAIAGTTFFFNAIKIDPSASSYTLNNLQVVIYDAKGKPVRTITNINYDPTTGNGSFCWYAEKSSPQPVYQEGYTTPLYYTLEGGVEDGNYSIILYADYFSTTLGMFLPLKEIKTTVKVERLSTGPLDITPPRVISFSPENGSLVSDILVVSAALDDGAGVGPDLEKSSIVVKDTLGRLVGGIRCNNGVDTLYWTFTSSLPSGQYTIEVVPVDKNGNVGSLATSTFIIDNTPPVIQSVYPVGNVNSVTQIRVQYQDIGSGLDFWDNYPLMPAKSHIKMYTPDVPSKEVTLLFDKNLSSSIYAIANVPADVISKDGRYDLTIYLVDKAGNNTTTYTYFVIDRTPPKIISSTLPQTYVNYTLSQIKITVQDDTTGVSTYTLKTFLELKDSLGNTVPSTFTINVINPKTAELILNIDPTYSWQEGEYYLTIRVSDLLDNVLFVPQKFILDTTAPNILSISPTGNVRNVDKVSVKYSELGSGIDFTRSKVTITFQGVSTDTLFIPSESSDTELVARFESSVFSQDGTYNLDVILYDNAGNASTSNTTFILDRKGPIVKEVNPTRNSKLLLAPQRVWAVVADETIGLDLNLAKTNISLIDPYGSAVSGTYTYEKSSDDKTATLTLQISGYTWTNGVYTVIIKATDKLDNSISDTYTFTLEQVVQEIGDLLISPKVFSPSKGTLRIDYQFQAVSGNIQRVDIEIYSLNGVLVKKLSSKSYNTTQAQDTVVWDGKDSLGKLVPNGYYLVKAIIVESSGAVRIKFKGFVVIK